ncbi:hypothetical protein FRB90_011371 [Tulasnella sp. 427]|nr:hypothetical protein FRB90_011371 [Tulasnella sp. 427]
MLRLRFEWAYPDTTDITEMYNHRLVSRGWKDLIEGTPSLWSNISSNHPTPFIRDCLKWSGDHPLIIRVSHFDLWDTQPIETLKLHLQLLRPHSHRWKQLDFSVKSVSDAQHSPFSDFLESPAPKLRSLHVHIPLISNSPPPTLNLAGDLAQSLKSLRLTNVFIPWSSGLLVGLEEFSLDVTATPPAEEMVNIFSRSPFLKRFGLSYREGDTHGTPVLTNSSNHLRSSHITASWLKEVRLDFDDPQVAGHILSHVSMPNCTDIAMKVDLRSSDTFHVVEDGLTQFLPRLETVLRGGERIKLQVYEYSDFRYQWEGTPEEGDFKLFLDLSRDSLDVVIDYIGRVADACGTELELDVYVSDILALNPLGQRREIKRIEVPPYCYRSDETEPFPDRLGRFRVDAQNGITWPFPGLQQLDLYHSDYTLHSVFGMLNQRYLPSSYTQSLEKSGIPVSVPPKLDIWVKDPVLEDDIVLVKAIQKHWGVGYLNGVGAETEELESIGSE